MKLFFKLPFILLLFFAFFFSSRTVIASDFTTNYKVDYYIDENNGSPITHVKMRIDILNHSTDTYISKFSIAFPKTFKVDNATALYREPITPDIVSTDQATTLLVRLPPPTLEEKTRSTIYFDFNQENLFKVSGNVWEVILPTIQNEKGNDYDITLHLPENSDKKLSISKPVPTTIDGYSITWHNPDVKTIYTTFGSRQYYSLHLIYHLQNDGIGRVYTEVAFPPDSLYQKMYIDEINPPPAQVSLDEDGNLIGRYYLNPRETKNIDYKSIAELYALPRAEVKSYQANQLIQQKNYLLQKNKFWSVNVLTNLKSPEDIFDYDVSALQYDTIHVNDQKKRLGANQALLEPNKAVCTEFTDVFVALARQKGIYAREIEGYGYSADFDLRPISTNSDILHAWPEYFDKSIDQWVAVDPTWQNTSGINYFSSLDLNHIIFAIHGKDPEYPLPAGTYKINNSKDVSVLPTQEIPKETRQIHVASFTIPDSLAGNRPYSTKLFLENLSNVYLWNIPIKLTSDFGLNKSFTIDVLAPMEKREIPVVFQTDKAFKSETKHLEMAAMGSTIYVKDVKFMPFYYEVGLNLGIVVIIGSTLLFFIKFFLKRK